MNAMGLAYTQGGGDSQMFVDCVLKCRVQHGFVADIAIKSVLLAQEGITGTQNILCGEKGFYAAFFPEHDAHWLTQGLGDKEFLALRTRVKGYPSCTYTHSAIETALQCVRENALKAEDVAEVRVGVNTPSYQVVCTPAEYRYNPRSIVDCQFSIPYTVACAIVNGKVFIDDFTSEAIRRPEVRDMMGKVRCEVDPEIDAFCPAGFDGAKVTITTRDGRRHFKRLDYVKGTPQNPMTMDDEVQKFQACVPFAARPIPKQNTDQAVDLVRRLETVEDVSSLVSLLTA
jgi:2-methylcitrate dehydratase PrpD